MSFPRRVVQVELEKVNGGDVGWKWDCAKTGSRCGRSRDGVVMLVGHGAVEVVNGEMRGGVVHRIGQVVDDLQIAIRFVELDVDEFAGTADGKEAPSWARSRSDKAATQSWAAPDGSSR